MKGIKVELGIEVDKELVFAISFGALFTNIALGAVRTIMTDKTFWMGDEISTKIGILAAIFLWIIALIYFSKKNNIMLWCPMSFCSSIYFGYLGVPIITIAATLVFGIIECIIMLILNFKQWYIPQSNAERKQLWKTGSASGMGVFAKLRERVSFFIIYSIFFLIFNISVIYKLGYEYKGIEFCRILAFPLIVFWFLGFCIQCRKQSPKENPYKKKKKIFVFIFPLLLLLLNIILEYAIVLFRESTIIHVSLVVYIIILLYVSKMQGIQLWYPCSMYCVIYGFSIWCETSDIHIRTFLIFVLVVNIIEYIIMLVLNRKLWRVPKR